MKLKVLFLTSFLIASCGISTKNQPAFEISDQRLGIELSDQTTTTQPVSSSGSDGIGRIYLVDDNDSLLLVRREGFRTSPGAQDILEAVAQAPLAREIEESGSRSLKTELPAKLNPRLVEANEDTGVLRVRVSDDAGLRSLAQTNTSRTNRVFAQIVCSLDWFQVSGDDGPVDVAGVWIEDSEGPIFATDSETALIDRPARTEDFRNCVS